MVPECGDQASHRAGILAEEAASPAGGAVLAARGSAASAGRPARGFSASRSSGRCRVRRSGDAAVLAVDALRLLELVFEDGDPARGLDGVPWPTSSRAWKLVAGVTTAAPAERSGVIRRASPIARRRLWVVPSMFAVGPC